MDPCMVSLAQNITSQLSQQWTDVLTMQLVLSTQPINLSVCLFYTLSNALLHQCSVQTLCKPCTHNKQTRHWNHSQLCSMDRHTDCPRSEHCPDGESSLIHQSGIARFTKSGDGSEYLPFFLEYHGHKVRPVGLPPWAVTVRT